MEFPETLKCMRFPTHPNNVHKELTCIRCNAKFKQIDSFAMLQCKFHPKNKYLGVWTCCSMPDSKDTQPCCRADHTAEINPPHWSYMSESLSATIKNYRGTMQYSCNGNTKTIVSISPDALFNKDPNEFTIKNLLQDKLNDNRFRSAILLLRTDMRMTFEELMGLKRVFMAEDENNLDFNYEIITQPIKNFKKN